MMRNIVMMFFVLSFIIYAIMFGSLKDLILLFQLVALISTSYLHAILFKFSLNLVKIDQTKNETKIYQTDTSVTKLKDFV